MDSQTVIACSILIQEWRSNRFNQATDYWLKWSFDNPVEFPDMVTEYEGISGPGDSGGPAFIIKDSVVYIAGFSSGQSTKKSNGIEGLYGVVEYYTRVSKYSKWIENHICN